jgi:hypothetical protein
MDDAIAKPFFEGDRSRPASATTESVGIAEPGCLLLPLSLASIYSIYSAKPRKRKEARKEAPRRAPAPVKRKKGKQSVANLLP